MGVQLFSVTSQICCSKCFAGQRFSLAKARWRPKKVFTQIVSVSSAQSEVNTKKKVFSPPILMDVVVFSIAQTQTELKDLLLQLTMSARKDQLTNHWRNLWRATLKPLAGHKWPTGRELDAPVLVLTCIWLLCRFNQTKLTGEKRLPLHWKWWHKWCRNRRTGTYTKDKNSAVTNKHVML